MQNLIEKISNIGVVPVIKIDRAEDALPLANALKNGGLCCAELFKSILPALWYFTLDGSQ